MQWPVSVADRKEAGPYKPRDSVRPKHGGARGSSTPEVSTGGIRTGEGQAARFAATAYIHNFPVHQKGPFAIHREVNIVPRAALNGGQSLRFRDRTGCSANLSGAVSGSKPLFRTDPPDRSTLPLQGEIEGGQDGHRPDSPAGPAEGDKQGVPSEEAGADVISSIDFRIFLTFAPNGTNEVVLNPSGVFMFSRRHDCRPSSLQATELVLLDFTLCV
jgi:hypothetical protein